MKNFILTWIAVFSILSIIIFGGASIYYVGLWMQLKYSGILGFVFPMLLGIVITSFIASAMWFGLSSED